MSEEDLAQQSGKGRGLWIGLFPEDSNELRMNIIAVRSLAPSDAQLLENHHVTLLHLGKNLSRAKVHAVCAASASAADSLPSQQAEMTGVIRFLKHVAIAFVPEDLILIRNRLIVAMRDHNVFQFTNRFTPHMTIAQLEKPVDVQMPAIQESVVRFGGVTVVCGDAKVHYPFSNRMF